MMKNPLNPVGVRRVVVSAVTVPPGTQSQSLQVAPTCSLFPTCQTFAQHSMSMLLLSYPDTLFIDEKSAIHI